MSGRGIAKWDRERAMCHDAPLCICVGNLIGLYVLTWAKIRQGSIAALWARRSETHRGSDKFYIAHRKELLDHGVRREHNLSLLHLHSCPAMCRNSLINPIIDNLKSVRVRTREVALVDIRPVHAQ